MANKTRGAFVIPVQALLDEEVFRVNSRIGACSWLKVNENARQTCIDSEHHC